MSVDAIGGVSLSSRVFGLHAVLLTPCVRICSEFAEPNDEIALRTGFAPEKTMHRRCIRSPRTPNRVMAALRYRQRISPV